MNNRVHGTDMNTSEYRDLSILMIFSNLQAIKEYQRSKFNLPSPVGVVNDRSGNKMIFADASASGKHLSGLRVDKVIIFSRHLKDSIVDEVNIMSLRGAEVLESE